MLQIGRKLLGRYEILSPLGAGGMGEVYLARDMSLRRDVAVKVLPERLASDPDALSRFEREAHAVAALSHPNILAIHDFGSDHETYFAVMELLEGETLGRRLKSSRLPWKKVIEIGAAVAEGLSAAHSKSVIHRDIKPENIFLTSDGQIKILDFGLAQWLPTTMDEELSSAPTESQLTKAGSVLGTVPYMSPEQVRGITADERSDIFALGSVLYEMLTGARTFSGKTPADTMASILKEEPNNMEELKKASPPELQRAISRCLQKNPEQRFQTARDLAFNLKGILSGSAVVARPPLKLPFRKSVWIAAALIAVALIAFHQTYFQREKAIHSIAVLPFANDSHDPNAEYLSDGISESLINNLSSLPNLRVMARGTVFTYKGRKLDPRQAGRDLKVEAVVTGRVLQQGQTLIIHSDMVRVSDGTQLWGEQYNRNLADVLKVQQDISNEIAGNLKLRLTGDQKKLLLKQNPENSEAFRFYLRARYEWWKGTPESYEKSREYSEKAIAADASYAPAYRALAGYYAAMASDGYMPPNEAWPKAMAAIQQALKIDSSLVEAHVSLANYKFFYLWDRTGAEREYKEVLSSGVPDGHRAYSWFLLALRRFDEALKEAKLATELDPLNKALSLHLGQTLGFAGRYDEAIQQLNNTLELAPNYTEALFSLADVYEAKGRYDEAISISRTAYEILGNKQAVDLFATAKGKAGYEQAERKIAEQNLPQLLGLSEESYVSPLDIASIYSLLNQKDEAFQWLEKAYNERSSRLVFLNVHRDWDNLRSDPRFAKLVKRIGLP
jgi:serine/threonine protein kinase